MNKAESEEAAITKRICTVVSSLSTRVSKEMALFNRGALFREEREEEVI